MKIQFQTNHCSLRERGISLIECMVYISAVSVVLGVASTAFYQCWDAHKAIRRNSEDIVTALHVGEQWRADIRAATGPIRPTADNGGQQLHLPGARGEIVYTFSNGTVSRRIGDHTPEVTLLPRVRASQMELELRSGVTAWRWELELRSMRKTQKLKPLFTFEAVASTR